MIFCLFWFLVNMMHGLKENIVFFIIWKILQKIVKEKSLWKVQDFSPTHNFRQLSHLSLLIFLGGDKNKKREMQWKQHKGVYLHFPPL